MKPESQPAAQIELLTGAQLADKMTRDPCYVTAMLRAGYKFRYATRTTLDHALEWLEQHQDFRAYKWLTKQKTREIRRKASLAGRRHQAGSVAGK